MFDIIVDTKEQQPWTFENINGDIIDNIIHHNLDTGDYTIAGFEETLCIERKKSVAELAKNITEARFERELERMYEFRHKFLILEFGYYNIDTYPIGSSVPKYLQSKIKITGSYILKKLSEIAIKYDIHVIPCDNRTYAEIVAVNLMKRIYEQYNK
jgi:hypothetical protein